MNEKFSRWSSNVGTDHMHPIDMRLQKNEIFNTPIQKTTLANVI